MYLDERYILTYDIERFMKPDETRCASFFGSRARSLYESKLSKLTLLSRKWKGIIMSNTLRWVKFESVMTAIYGVNGITAPKTCELTDDPISLLVHS